MKPCGCPLGNNTLQTMAVLRQGKKTYFYREFSPMKNYPKDPALFCAKLRCVS